MAEDESLQRETLLKRRRSGASPEKKLPQTVQVLIEEEEPEEPEEPQPSFGHDGYDGYELRLEKLQSLGSSRAILSVDFALVTLEQKEVPTWKLVTAGQDGCVKIWALPLPSPSQSDTVSPRWLCTVKHEAAVNCARWAPDGRMIASCDAEAALLVWAPGVGNLHLLQDLKAPEPWHRHCLLRGHQGEVCDVSWHPKLHPDFTLASCSHDGSVRLWSVPRVELTAILRPESSESGYIKGVAFDPLGQFLACMSDGKQLAAMLYQSPEENDRGRAGGAGGASGWEEVPINQAPWAKPGQMSAVNFRRPCWDPLGESVVFPFGEHKKSPLSTCRFYSVLFTAPWKTPKLYRGHKKHVAVVRFCPIVFAKVAKGAEELAVVLALGCMDGMLSLWLSSHPVPILILKDLVDENCFITDIAWTADASALVYSSSGGVGSISISWKRILPGFTPWTLDEVLRWRSQRHLHITQPSWDLPTTHSLKVPAELGRLSAQSPNSRYFVEDPELRRSLEGLEWSSKEGQLGQLGHGGIRPSVNKVLDVNSCCERQKLLKSWHSRTMPKTCSPSPPTFAWSIEDDNMPADGVDRRILRIEPTSGSCRVSSKSEGGLWQISVERVVLAKLQGPSVVLVVESAVQSTRWQLLILASQSGRLRSPPLVLKACPGKLQLAKNGSLLLLLDIFGLTMWQLPELPGAPSLLLRTCPVPNGYHDLANMGVLSTSGRQLPYVRRRGKGHVLLFHHGTKSWLTVNWKLLQKVMSLQHREDAFCTWPDASKRRGLPSTPQKGGPFGHLALKAVRQVLPWSPGLLDLLLELGLFAVEEDLPGLLSELQAALAKVLDDAAADSLPPETKEVTLARSPSASLVMALKDTPVAELRSTASQLQMLLSNLRAAEATEQSSKTVQSEGIQSMRKEMQESMAKKQQLQSLRRKALIMTCTVTSG
ncbi:unnamed protein product [Durusdinium trenchii]|uniref:Protein HIRA n=1 Tax=Durusdinium trenchii TaxID=1381693 RepID=A0ABP0Q7A4_9DINO